MSGRSLLRVTLLALVSFSSVVEAARFDEQGLAKTSEDRTSRNIELNRDGWLRLENAVGRVTVIGSPDQNGVALETTRTIRALDDASLAEAKQQTRFIIAGDSENRLVKTEGTFARTGRWSTQVSYTLRVPRNANIGIHSFFGELIQVSNLAGELVVSTVNGKVDINGVSGNIEIETINAGVWVNHTQQPVGNTSLTTVNGEIEVRVPPGTRFAWSAQSLQGTIFSAIPTRGGFEAQRGGPLYRAAANGGSSPQISTASMAGRIYLLDSTSQRAEARQLVAPDVRPAQSRQPTHIAQPIRADIRPVLQRVVRTFLVRPPNAKVFAAQWGSIPGNFRLDSTLGNVFVGEINGNASINSKAGEIVLGRVAGRCDIRSNGGPINLGDIAGTLDAATSAGNILVQSARKGGILRTDGGEIQVLSSGGPLTARSGGGDVVLRKASGPVDASTRSGDILITIDPSRKTDRLSARSAGGNIVLNLGAQFAATIDAVIVSSTESEFAIDSDFAGLTISHERVGSKFRIRATGKINGGGERVELHVEEGNIQIRRQ